MCVFLKMLSMIFSLSTARLRSSWLKYFTKSCKQTQKKNRWFFLSHFIHLATLWRQLDTAVSNHLVLKVSTSFFQIACQFMLLGQTQELSLISAISKRKSCQFAHPKCVLKVFRFVMWVSMQLKVILTPYYSKTTKATPK